jgi:hypothetical protein
VSDTLVPFSDGPQTSGPAFAVAFWGGRFYLFTGYGPAVSFVHVYDPVDGAIALVLTQPGVTIVGAGVSTCAPQ